MGKTVSGLFGGGQKVDTSGYEKQLEEQRKATAEAEAEAARKKAESDAAAKRQAAGRASTLLTGAAGDDSAPVRRSVLGAG